LKKGLKGGYTVKKVEVRVEGIINVQGKRFLGGPNERRLYRGGELSYKSGKIPEKKAALLDNRSRSGRGIVGGGGGRR